ncbi:MULTISPECIES: NAD(P)/FAD-dependent oxidoreductase [Nocardioides]|uniref:NAD(P)/FAD-dependent oxidoreductase n=1 Tax=Nocardioides vastitatis TaxID=2568655 RepID=A0ABW0ZMI3_9ACTN|nr:NAD(P)/FAD-dependent oxidoreductase [Nocardioides sp.]THJ03684.1 NAD(P)/FAD-dependent oxidoreductase [Nocardioides sp.]
MRDLLVIGGGPAGLASALYAARTGLEVTVWDKRAGIIDKACGEGLMPGAITALADVGVNPDGRDLTGIRYLAGRRAVEAPFHSGLGRGVRRTTLHTALRSAAECTGISLEHRIAEDVRPDSDGVTVDGQRFRYVVAADGLHSTVRRGLGLAGRPVPRRRYGLRRHYLLEPWTSYVEVHWAESVEAYVTPVTGDVVGLALLTSARGAFDDHLARFASLRERLQGATPLGDVLGAGPLRQRARSRVAGRVLLVGDAGGYVDALTGEGVAMAVSQARAAIAAIVGEDPMRYERDWHAITRRYRLLTASLLGATRFNPVRRALVPTAERLPGVFSAAVNSLARPS